MKTELEKMAARLEKTEAECARLQVFVNASIPFLRPYAHSFGAMFKDGRTEYSGSVVSFENASSVVSSLLARLDRMTEALNGYRAAISYVGADSWDGCDDCIEILKAASAADSDKPRLTADQAAVALSRLRALGGQVGEG